MNLDRTFCASAVHKPDCDRQITPEVEAAMKRSGKPYYSMAYFCGEPEKKGTGHDE